MRNYCGATMSFWHCYKKMSERVWHLGLLDFFGPIFHEICPANKLKVKPPLRIITTFFYYLMFAYKHFKYELNNAIKQGNLPPSLCTRLLNLQDLCEFFIPVVSFLLNVYVQLIYIYIYICLVH